MDKKTKAYFEKSSVQYSKGDVEMLVDPKKDFKCAVRKGSRLTLVPHF